MKASKHFGFYGIIVWLCFLTACGSPDISKTDTQKTSPAHMDEEKTAYLQQVRTRLNELGIQIEELREPVGRVAPAARDEMRAAVEGLSGQQKTLRQQAEALATAAEEQWATLKAQLDADVADLQRSYNEVRQFLQ